MPGSKRDHDEIERLLGEKDYSQPTRMRSSDHDRPSVPIDEPATKAPPKPAHPPELPEQNIKPVDPFDVARPQFKVRLFDLLRLRVPTEVDGEITHTDRAGNYLVVDKYFHYIIMGKFKHFGIEPLDGKLQAMYLWFYFKSYGEGYSACPMGYAELRARLGWTRNTLRSLLAELETYGLIEALEDFRPFDNRRPQVYRVHLPREFVAAKWRELEEQERRKAGEEGIARLKALLDRDPETKKAIEDLGVTDEANSRSHSA